MKDFTGTWKDDQGRVVEVQKQDGKANDGKVQLFYNDEGVAQDGSKLMMKKRGEEKGWPIQK